MRKKLDALENAVDEFCLHHDYRKISGQMSPEAENSLKEAKRTIYGAK